MFELLNSIINICYKIQQKSAESYKILCALIFGFTFCRNGIETAATHWTATIDFAFYYGQVYG